MGRRRLPHHALTAAVLGAIGPARSGIASAVNNAVSRIAGLLAIASLAVIAGGTLDLAGFHRAALACAVLMAAGAVASFSGIRGSIDGREPASPP